MKTDNYTSVGIRHGEKSKMGHCWQVSNGLLE